ncbi:MAG: nucleotidyltransferase domain-containing protein [Candidatus Lokiarchaeia archaeon]
MQTIKKKYETALMTFRDKVIRELGGNIESIIVYGSVARGEARKDSDIDVLIVGGDKDLRSRISKISYDVDYENDFETFITSIYLTKDELKHRVRVGSPFIYEVLRDGVILYDNGTFQRIREKVFGTSG